MSNWKEYTLDELCDFQNGFAFKNSDYVECSENTHEVFRMGYINRGGGFKEDSTPVFISKSYPKNLDKFILKVNDITIAMTDMKNSMALLGYCARISHSNRFVLNQRVGRIRVSKENLLDPIYLYYYLNSPKQIEYLRANANSGVQVNLGTETIKKSILKIPSIDGQKEISHILFCLDQKIELNTQINQTLEQIAQAIFKSWFVDFDPVRAKAAALESGKTHAEAELAAMQAISGKTAEELAQMPSESYAELAEIAKAFPSGFGEDGVPMGWELSTIGQEVETVGGATPSTKEEQFWNNGEIAWTTPKDLSSATSPVLLKTDRKITELGLKRISSGLLPIGTVLLSSRAPVGYLSLAQIPVAINQGYIAIKCNKSLNNYYMLQWCKENLEEIKGRASGTTFLEISKTTFRQIPIIVPDGNVLSLFEKQCSSIYQSITVNAKENLNLGKTRDLLLPKLLNGDL